MQLMRNYFTGKFPIHILFLICLLTISKSLRAQDIPSLFFGQNAWMPDTVGDPENCRKPPCDLRGKLHKHWADVQSSGAKLIRYGGKKMDRNFPTYYQYIRIVDSIRARGMEPILQVPCDKNKYTSKQAADLVTYINITKGRKVKYWSIGNEPEQEYKFVAGDIAKYIKEFASAMKSIDPSILTLGPELSRLDTIVLHDFMEPGGVNDLCGKDAKGQYYLDVITFHYYPFSGKQNRDEVIHKLRGPDSYEERLNAINRGLNACNKFHNRDGANALKIALTEANIAYKNLNDDEDLIGTGTHSFLAGQFWAEMLGIGLEQHLEFINFFSVIEGQHTDTNIGFIDSYDGQKNPSFYHFQLMADNMKGRVCKSHADKPLVKVFATKNDKQIAAIIMNQDVTGHTLIMRHDNGKIAGASDLKINIDANVNIEYPDRIEGQSTILLVFDLGGQLVKKSEYKMNGHADKKLPPSVLK